MPKAQIKTIIWNVQTKYCKNICSLFNNELCKNIMQKYYYRGTLYIGML